MVTIFIVDDEENLHQIYHALFSMKGHTVVASAFDGVEAIEKYQAMNPKPDIILMDHRMPRMDGVNTTKMLVRMDPSCKVIFISADETAREEALTAGAVSFHVKPVRASELFAIIAKIMK